MAKAETKPYRLTSGEHRMPNPNFQQDVSDPVESHTVVQAGEICELTDEQFKAFKHKFAPLGSNATDVRDADRQQLENAKTLAALTKQNVDPNTLTPDKFAAARAGVVPQPPPK